MTDDERNLDRAQKDQRDIGAAEDDPHTTGPAENLREEAAEMVNENDRTNDPMSPENIREHEPTAVNRDQENSEIVEEGQAGTRSTKAQEKYRRKGMTEV
ncbi:MAG TPA: hypothetical protein VIP56_07580 [Nitrososphaeraceae archaeon]